MHRQAFRKLVCSNVRQGFQDSSLGSLPSLNALLYLPVHDKAATAVAKPWEFPAVAWRKYNSGTGVFRVSGALPQGIVAERIVEATAPSLQGIVVEDLVINLTEHPKAKPVVDPVALKFGSVYTDHMLQIHWKEGLGWSVPSINELGPLPIHPCAQVLHYGLECFEGMKAYKTRDGSVRLFRPNLNMDRFIRSAQRLAFPPVDKEAVLELIKILVHLERDWIPDEEGFSVYIRPTMISTHPFLGVGPSREAMIFVVLSPVGPYSATGLEPITLFVENEYVRAFPGGVGDAKIGGNYAPTILPQLQAAKKGCSQVLFVLQNVKGGLIGESSTMNVFFLLKDKNEELELATPQLNGVILPGVTRDTVLALTRSFGNIKVSERDLYWEEIEEASANGSLLEVFGTGTACMIQPVMGLLTRDSTRIHVPFDKEAAAYWTNKPAGSSIEELKAYEPFNLCGRLTRAIIDIQYGHVESDWSVVVDSSESV